MIVLAIDPSTTSTGWCIFNTDMDYYEEYGTIKPTTKEPIRRIIEIYKQLRELIRVWKPELVVIENLSVTRNANTTKILAGLQVQIEILCVWLNLLYAIVRPSEWRKVVGIKGKTRKEQKANAIQHVTHKYNIKVNEDEADAICIGEYAKSIKVEEE